ncbi:DUF418 domain-containing protein [Krasilnikoviella flava]|uniref:Uncharacterized membrane protein YeiB n=1 Tax=Krasilnikoviella flava TaxID=526729 RepID=A0A1T5LK62_9MICO|nr:DUF418 domain-containing protein [Krasilnikoviella flava]SKC76381.1 Uncharacterized membrane protein YeiB [Krasilnikoviella flava]
MSPLPTAVPAGTPSAPPLLGRSPAPDLARGWMLALIAVANVMIYLVGRPYGFRQHVVEDGAVDHAVSAAVVTLVDGRAYPLFAFLFGYGMVQLSERRRSEGAGDAEVRQFQRRRSVVLIAFGAVHGMLLFPGDILGWYGVVGLLLAALMRRSDRALLWVAGLWLVPAAVVTGLVYGLATGPERGFLWSFEMTDPLAALASRPMEWVMAPFGLLPVVTAALVGVVAARHHVLEQPFLHRRLLRRTALVGILLAVAGGAPSGIVAGGYLPAPGVSGSVTLAVVHALTGVAGGLGLAAVFALLASRSPGRPGVVVGAVAATGRRSLSAYLSQSVVFVLLLTLPLVGLGAHLGTAAATLLAVAVWATTVVVSAALDGRGVRGPAERLLRHLASRGRGPRRARLPRPTGSVS